MLKHFGKVVFILFLGVFLLGVPNTGSASISLASISLEFQPLDQTVNQGATASVGIWVTDPGDTKVAAFDFWVNYDSSIITLNNINWGTNLGVLDTAEGSSTQNAGYQNDEPYLVGLWAEGSPTDQNGSGFLLATINFNTVGVGTSALWFTDAFETDANDIDDLPRDYFLSDENFEYISVNNPIETGKITVAKATSVPEPGTVLLLGLGLAALASLKKRTS